MRRAGEPLLVVSRNLVALQAVEQCNLILIVISRPMIPSFSLFFDYLSTRRNIVASQFFCPII